MDKITQLKKESLNDTKKLPRMQQRKKRKGKYERTEGRVPRHS